MQRDPDHRQPDASTWLAEIEEALAPEQPPPPPQPEPTPAPVADPDPVMTVPMAQTQASSSSGGSGWGKLLISSMIFCAAAVGLLAGLLFSLGRDPELEAPPSEAEGVSINISGPDEVQVGEAAVFTAEVEGVDSWVWSLPTSTHIANEEEAVMTATEPGEAEVVLMVTACAPEEESSAEAGFEDGDSANESEEETNDDDGEDIEVTTASAEDPEDEDEDAEEESESEASSDSGPVDVEDAIDTVTYSMPREEGTMTVGLHGLEVEDSITRYDLDDAVEYLGGESEDEDVIVLETDILFSPNEWELPEVAPTRTSN